MKITTLEKITKGSITCETKWGPSTGYFGRQINSSSSTEGSMLIKINNDTVLETIQFNLDAKPIINDQLIAAFSDKMIIQLKQGGVLPSTCLNFLETLEKIDLQRKGYLYNSVVSGIIPKDDQRLNSLRGEAWSLEGVNLQKNTKPQEVLQSAFNCFLKAEILGNTAVQLDIAKCYHFGQGVDQDLKKAFEYFKNSADQGNVEAQWRLGHCYLNGSGTDLNKEEGFKYYKMSADAGNVEAMFLCGECYNTGEGVAKDYSGAVNYYTLAANHGHPYAHLLLGEYWSNKSADEKLAGMKEKANEYYAKAKEYYAKARVISQKLHEEERDATAQLVLGMLHRGAPGVTKNEELAIVFFNLSAATGNKWAQEIVGDYFFIAKEQDDTAKAKVWFEKSAAQGNKRAKAKLEKILSEK